MSDALRLVTERGFGAELTGSIVIVGGHDPVRARAARDCVQTVIADVTTDPGYERYREIAVAAGFRAVQSTPLADSSGRVFGIVTTHFRQPDSRPVRNLRIMDLYGDLAGEAVARCLKPTPGGAALGLAGSYEDNPRSGLGDELAPPETALAGFAGEIVQRLSAAGLSLAIAQAIIGDGPAGDQVAAAVDDLDRAIRDIRAAVSGPPARAPAPRLEPGL